MAKAQKAIKVKGKEATKTPKSSSHSDLLEKFRPKALKIREEKVIPCRADVRLANANIKVGVESVFGPEGSPERRARVTILKESLPKLSTSKALDLSDLGRALMLAASKVAPASAGEIEAKLSVVRALREPMLKQAEILGERGLFPSELVAKIRSGTGKIDIAEDGVALYDLYTTHADKVKGQHPFTSEELQRLREAAEWLVDHLNPGGARPKATAKKSAAEDLRDRLWTMVYERHSDLRVMGYYLYRDELDRYVPKLQSRLAGARGEVDEAKAPPAEEAVKEEHHEMAKEPAEGEEAAERVTEAEEG